MAFLPVLAVDYVLDGYVKSRETQKLQAAVDAITHDSQIIVQDAVQALRVILHHSPSLCTPTFFSNVNAQLQRSRFVRQIAVENAEGIQYCAAYDGVVNYRALSESLAIPGHTEVLSVVELEGEDHSILKISQRFGGNRTVSAFVEAVPLVTRDVPLVVGNMRHLVVSLTNGAPVVLRGDAVDAAPSSNGDYILARSFAGDIPLKAEAGVSFETVRAGYAELDIGLTLVACLLGVTLLLLALQFARRSNLPSFEIERAIVAGEMKPYYQPVINLKTGKLIGCEVLVRWVKRNGEVVPPGAFIDYAEISGLAVPMTLSLMEQVRFDLEELCAEVPDFKVSINLFEGHFRDGSIVEDIQSIFGGSGINYRQLVFEITERRPLDDKDAVNTVVSAMHKLGVRIAMDDAGTGHSNLAYLQTLGIDIVKIDKIFVDMIRDANVPVPVIDGLIAMAKDMDIEIIAEGVETQEQALYLRSKNVFLAQGYLFSPPVKLSSFLTLANALKPQARRSNFGDDLAA